MTEEFLFKLLGNVAAPVVICMYTLLEVNKNVKRLADSIDRFGKEIDKRVDKLEAEVRELTVDVKTLTKRGLP